MSNGEDQQAKTAFYYKEYVSGWGKVAEFDLGKAKNLSDFGRTAWARREKEPGVSRLTNRGDSSIMV